MSFIRTNETKRKNSFEIEEEQAKRQKSSNDNTLSISSEIPEEKFNRRSAIIVVTPPKKVESIAPISLDVPSKAVTYLKNGMLIDKEKLIFLSCAATLKVQSSNPYEIPLFGNNFFYFAQGTLQTDVGDISVIDNEFYAVCPVSARGKNISYLENNEIKKSYVTVKYLQHISSGKWFELKMFEDIHENNALIERIQTEIKCLQKTGQLVSVTAEDNLVYITKQYIPGIDLYHYLKDNPNLSFIEKKEIAIKIIEALENLHKHNIFHCDIKLDNIIYNPTTKEITFIDFEISLISDESKQVPIPRILSFTQGYLAPELMKKDPVINEKTEVFALGTTLFELFNTRTSRSMGSYMFFDRKILPENPVLEILTRAIHHDPDQRLCLAELKSILTNFKEEQAKNKTLNTLIF